MNLFSTNFSTNTVITGCLINFQERKTGQNESIFKEFCVFRDTMQQTIRNPWVSWNSPFHSEGSGMNLLFTNFRISSVIAGCLRNFANEKTTELRYLERFRCDCGHRTTRNVRQVESFVPHRGHDLLFTDYRTSTAITRCQKNLKT